MKKAIVLLCALCLVLVCGAALAAAPTKPAVSTTLNDIPPAWSKTLQCDTTACPRFELVMGGTAVLDHETGLVWEQSPDDTVLELWRLAPYHCNSLKKGGRLGWRVPTIQELASLVDPSVPSPGPTLPSGHPFSNVQSAFYESATKYPGDDTWGWLLDLSDGRVYGNLDKIPLGKNAYVWCVRSGQGVDAQ